MIVLKKICLFWLIFCIPTQAMAVIYNCTVEKKLNVEKTYTELQLEKGKFSVKISDQRDNTTLSRCSFAYSEKTVTCDNYKVDKVTNDKNAKIKKYYVFSSQFDVQILSDLSFIENNGRGGISFGKCKVISP